MLSAIIATHNSERELVPTLAALVPGATAGLVKEVILADGGSHDATAEVADFAGCRFIVLTGSRGARLAAAAAAARAPWLMFLRADAVPEPGWVDAVERFIAVGDTQRAAVFRSKSGSEPLHPRSAELIRLFWRVLSAPLEPAAGLVLAKHFYEQLSGHPDDERAEAALLRRIGRRRIALLACGVARADT